MLADRCSTSSARAQVYRHWHKRSQRQACGAHFVGQLTGARGVQVAAHQALDLGRLGVELLGKGPHAVAVPGQPWLQLVELLGQHGLDHLGRDRLLAADPERFLERERQVPLGQSRVVSAHDGAGTDVTLIRRNCSPWVVALFPALDEPASP